nr:dipeptidase [Actinomycetota bacterium]
GLTELGEYAVGRLMDRGMLIEVDHMSEWARDRVLAIAQERGRPLVSSHTGTGGTWHESELTRLAAVGGFASATLDDAAKLPDKVLAFGRYGLTPGLSTDTGGFAALPAPAPDRQLDYPFTAFSPGVRFTRQQTGERTFDLNTDGMAHYGLLPDLLALTAQEERGREALAALFGSAEAYLRTWERAGA